MNAFAFKFRVQCVKNLLVLNLRDGRASNIGNKNSVYGEMQVEVCYELQFCQLVGGIQKRS